MEKTNIKIKQSIIVKWMNAIAAVLTKNTILVKDTDQVKYFENYVRDLDERKEKWSSMKGRSDFCHELVHIKQLRNTPYYKILILWFKGLGKEYKEKPLEVDAYGTEYFLAYKNTPKQVREWLDSK